jgi:hypothetical protein
MKGTHYTHILKFLSLVLIVFLQSCSTMYMPSVKNVPLFEKAGEGLLEGGITSNSFFATGSYALTKDIAVSVNGGVSFADLFQKIPLEVSDPYAHNYWEASVGKINLIPHSSIRMEVFAGYGRGNALNSDAKYYKYAVVPEYKSGYQLGFMQFDIGRRFRLVEFGGALRAAVSEVHFNYSDKLTNENANSRFSNLHLEPSFVVRAGKKIKPVFRVGLGLSRWLSEPTEQITKDEWFRITFLCSIGVSYRF